MFPNMTNLSCIISKTSLICKFLLFHIILSNKKYASVKFSETLSARLRPPRNLVLIYSCIMVKKILLQLKLLPKFLI